MKQTGTMYRSTDTRTNTEVCQECGGSGMIVFQAIDEAYDPIDPIWFGKTCPSCGGITQEERERIAGIPTAYKGATLNTLNFDLYRGDSKADEMKKRVRSFIDDFEKWRANRLGLYLWSTATGTGKTLTACAIGNEVSKKYGITFRYITVPKYLAVIQEEFKANPGQSLKSNKYKDTDLLLLDDIGTQRSTEFANETLFDLVDRRYLNGKITIYTSNMKITDLSCDQRIRDRINDTAISIEFPEVPVRTNQANARKKNFLSGLGLI